MNRIARRATGSIGGNVSRGPGDRSSGMKALWAVALLLGTPVALAGQDDPGQRESGAVEAQVHAFWSALDEVWGEREPDRFAALFTAEASFQFVNRGEALEGRPAIHRRFVDQFSRQSPDLRHRTTIHEVRIIGDGVPVFDGVVEVVRTGPDERGGVETLATLAIFGIMEDSDEGWRVHLLRAYDLPGEGKGWRVRLRGDRHGPAEPARSRRHSYW